MFSKALHSTGWRFGHPATPRIARRAAKAVVLQAVLLFCCGASAPNIEKRLVAPAAILEEGRTAAKRGDYAKALERFHTALAESPEDPTTLYYLALTHQVAGNPLPAIAWYRAYLAAAPDADAATDAIRQIGKAEAVNRDRVSGLLAMSLRKATGRAGVDSELFDDGARLCAVQLLIMKGEVEQAKDLIPAFAGEIMRRMAIVELVSSGHASEAIAVTERLYPGNVDALARVFELLTAFANDEQARLLLPRLGPNNYSEVAVLHAKAGRIDDALRALGTCPRGEPVFKERSYDGFLMHQLWAASSSAVRRFREFRGDAGDDDLVAIIHAAARWGYLDDAERIARSVEHPMLQCHAQVYLCEAKAVLRKITPKEHSGQLSELTRESAKLGGALNFLRLSMVFAEIAQGNMDAAKRLSHTMKVESDRINDNVVAVPSILNYDPEGPNWATACRLVMEAQAESGDLAAAQTTAGDLQDEDRKIADLFLAGMQPRQNAARLLGAKSDQVLYAIARIRAATIHARRGDIARAMAILQDPNPDVPRIDRSKQGVVALASIAAAAHKRGDRKSSQAIMKELCGMAERAWASSIEDHVDPFLFRSIAVEFARGGDQEALRVIARHAFSVSRPDNIKNLGHLISQLQESIGDRGGAEQTLRWSRWYSPEMEIAHWSALARAIESVDLFVGDPTSRPDVLQESSKMSKAATVLLRTQQQLQFTSTLWRKVPRQTWRAG